MLLASGALIGASCSSTQAPEAATSITTPRTSGRKWHTSQRAINDALSY